MFHCMVITGSYVLIISLVYEEYMGYIGFAISLTTLCILETPKRVVWQTVKTQMKCRIMCHSSGSALFFKINKIFMD